MENPFKYLLNNIRAYFTKTENVSRSRDRITSLIRVHSDRLRETGDLSFTCSLDVWQLCCDQSGGVYQLKEDVFKMFETTETEEVLKARKDFLAVAEKWLYPLERLQLGIEGERCVLFFNRSAITKRLMKLVLNEPQDMIDDYGCLKKNSLRRIFVEETAAGDHEENKLALYRTKLVRDTIKRVLEYSEWVVESNYAETTEAGEILKLKVLNVCQREQYSDRQPNDVVIKVGVVNDPETGRVTQMQTEEYLKIRSNDMLLMAMHKHGLRARNNLEYFNLMQRIGTAAVTVDLLEVKHSSPVQIIRNGHGCTKGASFILYNSARLESLLRSFDERVRLSTYGQLPDIENVDWGILQEEEEWQLVYKYVFAFPNLIERITDQLDKGHLATHMIIVFLNGLTSLFSVYYRRVRILSEEREQLMPYVYARIYLVKAVRQILNKALALLDIEPVSVM